MSATETIPTTLGSEDVASLASLLRTVLWIFCLVPLLSILFSIFSETLALSRQRIRPCRMRYDIENFSNYKPTRNWYSMYKNYQSVPLTAPQTPETKNTPFSLIGGEAHRYIRNGDYQLQIFANMYVLDGNILQFDTKAPKIQQAYKVYLENGNERMFIGDLQKDGDGIYKLNKKIKNGANLANYKKVIVTYKFNDQEKDMIAGNFA